jgi:TPP-dependent indolepyruvate ferredoxin oxidoreductase alpha subunit
MGEKMIVINQHACPQNHACPAVRHCPAGALIQDDIFSAPHINQELCTECGACTQICHAFSQVPSAAIGVA